MFGYVCMRLLETQPRRYDAGIEWLTLGAARWARRQIVARCVREGDALLDIGTGTGTLALMAAERGAHVVGLDQSAAMLAVAEEKRNRHPAGQRVELVEAGVAELDVALAGRSFDAVAASLLFSELSEDEQGHALSQCHKLLVPGGLLAIADETRPPAALRRLVCRLVRAPLVVVTFALTQTTTRPVVGLEAKARAAGFRIEEAERRNLGSFLLLTARKGTES